MKLIFISNFKWTKIKIIQILWFSGMNINDYSQIYPN
jgi:hypothetical protein